jgi:hypothetical protein
VKHRVVTLILMLALAGSVYGFQAGGSTQPPPAAQPSAQQKQAESECMHWAKQQAGLEQPGSSQQPAASGSPDQQSAATANQNPPAKPADNSPQPSGASGMAGAASSMAGNLGGGAMNSKAAGLVKEAYTKCMKKKGYNPK